MTTNAFKAQSLQVLTLCTHQLKDKETMTRDMMCAVIDAICPLVKRVLLIGGCMMDDTASSAICMYDVENDKWEVSEKTAPISILGRKPCRAAWIDFDTVWMTTGRDCMTLNLRELLAGSGEERLFVWSPPENGMFFRCGPDSTLLNLDSGDLLLLGGTTRLSERSMHATRASHRVYHPQANRWEIVSNHALHDKCCCVVMHGGRVLVMGGRNRAFQTEITNECFLYSIKARRFTKAPSMKQARVGAAGCLLPDGRVFICGGLTDTCEIFDPAKREWATGGRMEFLRGGHACILLGSQVLIVGGASYRTDEGTYKNECEIYDLATDKTRRVAFLPILVMCFNLIALYD